MGKKEEEVKDMVVPPLPLQFFQMQSVYAHKMAEMAKIPLEQAIRENTIFYKRIGALDWNHVPENPRWKEYWKKVLEGEDSATTAYKIYMEKFATSNPNRDCFTYSYEEKDKTIHLHFSNNFANGKSPLDPVNLPKRRGELKRIFGEIKEKYPGAKSVAGFSWLYSMEAYKSLFPKEFTGNLKQTEPGTRGNGAWGQFLTHRGELNLKRADMFLGKVEKAKTLEELQAAFPIPTFETNCEIEKFYEFFNTSQVLLWPS
jgi:hypothetical protein